MRAAENCGGAQQRRVARWSDDHVHGQKLRVWLHGVGGRSRSQAGPCGDVNSDWTRLQSAVPPIDMLAILQAAHCLAVVYLAKGLFCLQSQVEQFIGHRLFRLIYLAVQ